MFLTQIDQTDERVFVTNLNPMVNRFIFQEGTDEGTAIMIVGNKTDLVEDENGRPVKSQDGMKLAEVMTCFSAQQTLEILM